MLVIPRMGPFEARQVPLWVNETTRTYRDKIQDFVVWCDGIGLLPGDDNPYGTRVQVREVDGQVTEAMPGDWIVKYDERVLKVVPNAIFVCTFQEFGQLRDPTGIERDRRNAIQEAHDAQVQE